jgi:hypothetical protein
MGELEFILQGVSFPAEKLLVHQVCDALTYDPQKNQLSVKSDVTGDILCLFISAVHREEIELINENTDGLLALCHEFQFSSLSRRLDIFKNTPTYRREQRFNAQEAKLTQLQESLEKNSKRRCESSHGVEQTTSKSLLQRFEAKLRLFTMRSWK